MFGNSIDIFYDILCDVLPQKRLKKLVNTILVKPVNKAMQKLHKPHDKKAFKKKVYYFFDKYGYDYLTCTLWEPLLLNALTDTTIVKSTAELKAIVETLISAIEKDADEIGKIIKKTFTVNYNMQVAFGNKNILPEEIVFYSFGISLDEAFDNNEYTDETDDQSSNNGISCEEELGFTINLLTSLEQIFESIFEIKSDTEKSDTIKHKDTTSSEKTNVETENVSTETESVPIEEDSAEAEDVPIEECSTVTEDVPNEECSTVTEDVPNEECSIVTKDVSNEECSAVPENVSNEDYSDETENVPNDECSIEPENTDNE